VVLASDFGADLSGTLSSVFVSFVVVSFDSSFYFCFFSTFSSFLSSGALVFSFVSAFFSFTSFLTSSLSFFASSFSFYSTLEILDFSFSGFKNVNFFDSVFFSFSVVLTFFSSVVGVASLPSFLEFSTLSVAFSSKHSGSGKQFFYFFPG